MEDDYSITISGEDAIVTIGEGKVVLKGAASMYEPLRPVEVVTCGEGNDVINCRRFETDSELYETFGMNIETGDGEDVIVNYEQLKEFLATGGGDKYNQKKTWRQSDNYTRQQKFPLQKEKNFNVRRRYR